MGNPDWVKGHPKIGGRKKGATNKTTQFRQVLGRCATPEAIEELWDLAFKNWRKGRAMQMAVLLPYFVQEMPKEVDHTGTIEIPMRFTIRFDKYLDTQAKEVPQIGHANGNT